MAAVRGMNLPRPPEVTLHHAMQLLWQMAELEDVATFLGTDTEYLVALMVGRVESDNPAVEEVREWARCHMTNGTTHTAKEPRGQLWS